MALAARLFDLTESWSELDTMIGASASSPSSLGLGLLQLRRLAVELSEPDDSDLLYEGLVYWYVQIRSEWAQTNLILHRQIMAGAGSDVDLHRQSQAASDLLLEVARLLEAADVEKVEGVLYDCLNGLSFSIRT